MCPRRKRWWRQNKSAPIISMWLLLWILLQYSLHDCIWQEVEILLSGQARFKSKHSSSILLPFLCFQWVAPSTIHFTIHNLMNESSVIVFRTGHPCNSDGIFFSWCETYGWYQAFGRTISSSHESTIQDSQRLIYDTLDGMLIMFHSSSCCWLENILLRK